MSLYETDFYSWTQLQAKQIRSGRLDPSDIENLAEEIESLGREQASKLRSAYRLIAMPLLKMLFQPKRLTKSWRLTIVRERANLAIVLQDNPGLKPRRAELFADAYAMARREAAADTGLSLPTFPAEPPFTLEQVESDDFWPEVSL